jgi:hypothetical protein
MALRPSLRVLAEAGGALDLSCSGASRLTLGVQSVSWRADHCPERPLLDSGTKPLLLAKTGLHPRKSVEQRSGSEYDRALFARLYGM